MFDDIKQDTPEEAERKYLKAQNQSLKIALGWYAKGNQDGGEKARHVIAMLDEQTKARLERIKEELGY